jgi:hypothetical protein
MREQGLNISDALKQAWTIYKDEHPQHEPYMKHKRPYTPKEKIVKFIANKINYRRCDSCNAHFGRADTSEYEQLEKKLPVFKNYCETCITKAGFKPQ